ncbi:MAG: hypothetical protein HFJ52_02695 [Clostridia bacterium]|nr:hypothetical protein [Clostridia bacterium]
MKVSTQKIVTLFIFVILIGSMWGTYSISAKTTPYEHMKDYLTQEAELNEEEEETLRLINKYRKENGLSELKTFAKLQEVAKLKAKDLVENEYFSHTSETLGTPFKMLQVNEIDYKIAGENLAGNTTPERAVESWKNSPSHNKNILDKKYDYTGICVIESPMYGKVFVELFIGID